MLPSNLIGFCAELKIGGPWLELYWLLAVFLVLRAWLNDMKYFSYPGMSNSVRCLASASGSQLRNLTKGLFHKEIRWQCLFLMGETCQRLRKRQNTIMCAGGVYGSVCAAKLHHGIECYRLCPYKAGIKTLLSMVRWQWPVIEKGKTYKKRYSDNMLISTEMLGLNYQV